MRIIYAKGKRGRKKKIHYKNIVLLMGIIFIIILIIQNIKKKQLLETVVQNMDEKT